MAVDLWDKGMALDPVVRRFTVGEDWLLDRVLLPWDLAGSAAHVRMLEGIGALPGSEADALVDALGRLRAKAMEGSFTVQEEDEDCHTAIEAALTAELGEPGRKIHLGRSRNDQVILALRLLMRERALHLCSRLQQFAEAQFEFIGRHGDLPMPGQTHLQPAMPSSLGLWAHAWIEAALESMRGLLALYPELDRCPLGAAAGFGTPVPTDREAVSRLLGFREPQRSVIDVIHSRARLESRFLHEMALVGSLLEKLACDVSLFLTREYGFLELDAEFRTGSSIMPQKQNPDVVELLRARSARLRGIAAEHDWVAAKLPSNYHRDLQLLKGPLMRGLGETEDCLIVATRMMGHLTPDEAALRQAMTADLDAARRASERALEGAAFRDAYREVASAAAMEGRSMGVPEHVLREHRSELARAREELHALDVRVRDTRAAMLGRVESVFQR